MCVCVRADTEMRVGIDFHVQRKSLSLLVFSTLVVVVVVLCLCLRLLLPFFCTFCLG